MSLKLNIINDKLMILYIPSFADEDWIDNYFENSDELLFKSLTLSKVKYISGEDVKKFIIGEVKDGLIYLDKEVFNIKHDFCIDLSFPLDFRYFVYTTTGLRGRNINFVSKISNTLNKAIILSDDTKYLESIPIKKYIEFIDKFPNPWELYLYTNKRIEEQLGVFLDIDYSYLKKYEKHLDKIKIKSKKTEHWLRKYELDKYKSLVSELEHLLKMDTLTESEWQTRVVEIILLIYPNYIHVLEKVKLNTEDGIKEIDLCLVNSNGCIDVIEIKKPFKEGILSERTYRNNYYPLKELSGALMQTEKYLYYLNRAGYTFEKELNERYNVELAGLFLKIRNPKGIIIGGNSSSFTNQQKDDFELIKKKYSNIMDIITYDDLITRLLNIIKFLEKD